MNTISTQEIKRRGISAVDEPLKKGPVHVIKNNKPQYVVLSEERFKELLEIEDEAHIMRVKESLEDVKGGRVTRGTAEELIKELGLED